ncbi:DUF1566 domain-containing protein [Marinomonas sp. A79]|uniref:DUF1566 domain-containing protein n=1 Tax=Marinomonas vulgaris TaxID=2823372 RepID=A0ABS5H9R9_9GAMM|nr:DUF1566 domain-containing protein [Marinomonas vulgaris]MBR7888365.1 DUF1566 domain-containing protein [Marinomonas vulgaris]
MQLLPYKYLLFIPLTASLGFLSGCHEVSEANSTHSASMATLDKSTPSVRYVLTDTQQENCYDNDGNTINCPSIGDALYGQDAQYQGVQNAFTNNGDQTITDKNTGLMWQKTPDFKHHSYDQAIAYCQNLTVAGYQDWRLPTIKELYSIADFRGEIVDPRDKTKNTPYIDTQYFDFQYDHRMAYIGQYWSITKYPMGPLHDTQNVDAAFGFNFADGHIKGYETGYIFGTNNSGVFAPGNFVRCTRGEENVYGVSEFVDNNNGTVSDKATDLMWQQTDDGTRRDWQASLAYAENSTLAGYSDWRLPNIKELQSLVKYEGSVNGWPAIDTNVFTLSSENTVADPMWVWSSTTQGDFKYSADYISFGKAFSKKNSSAQTYYDWHGAGAQRSDPKSGTPEDYEMASENAADLVMTKNYTLMVRSIN